MNREAIEKRLSVRTYVNKPLTEEERTIVGKILDVAQKIQTPFGSVIRFFTDHQDTLGDDEAKRIGTYGFIKNAPSFMGGVVKNTKEGIIDYGYVFEQIILMLTEKEFGTCWLAGTFQRQAFKDHVLEDEIIPAISPIGYPTDQPSFKERMVRFAIKANRRKPFQEMFFDHDFDHPISNNHPYRDVLELVQLGPSASNKQPWRILIEDQSIHLYLERTPGYATAFPFVMQGLDMGIAMQHLDIGLHEKKIDFERCIMKHPEKNGYEYIITYRLLK